jgi:hypothetical protein
MIAASLVVLGAFLPFWVFDFGFLGSFSVSFRESSGGDFALVLGAAAAILAVLRMRIGAILALVVTGLVIVWQASDLGAMAGVSLGIGTLVMVVGVIGGVIVLAIAENQAEHAPRTASGAAAAAPWVPPDFTPQPGTTRPIVDPEDPFRIIRYE